jgi:BolA family transcriptional regulator, general stress-responsive regulator
MSNSRTATIETMRSRLTATLSPLAIDIEDDSARHDGHAGAASGGGHFNLRVVSPLFVGLTRLQRHRLVYDPLADLMKREIHALSMVLLAPDEVDRTAQGAASPDY